MKLQDTVKQLQGEGVSLKILFLDSSDDVIVRRYKETRRKHPLDEVSYGNIRKAIETEREILRPIKAQADFYIDTSRKKPQQLNLRKGFIPYSLETTSLCILMFSRSGSSSVQ